MLARPGSPRLSLSSGAILLALVVFVGLEAAAMHLYPGGTWWDPAARGHRFWQNFLCDLEWRVALDGQPNALGARVAQAAMLVLVSAFAPFWGIVPRLFVRARTRARAVRALGWTSVVGMAAVSLMPSERFGALHAVAVVVAGVPGLTATALATIGLLGGEPRPRIAGWLGAAVLASAAIDFLLYVHTAVRGGPGPPLLPGIQKVALTLLLAWMATVAVRARA